MITRSRSDIEKAIYDIADKRASDQKKIMAMMSLMMEVLVDIRGED